MANKTPDEKRFVRVYKQSEFAGYHYIWVDRETRVQYLVSSISQGGGVTPLIDAEGKPLLYSGSLDKEE